MKDQKWMDILNEIDALGIGTLPLAVKKVKKEWVNMKSISKKR